MTRWPRARRGGGGRPYDAGQRPLQQNPQMRNPPVHSTQTSQPSVVTRQIPNKAEVKAYSESDREPNVTAASVIKQSSSAVSSSAGVLRSPPQKPTQPESKSSSPITRMPQTKAAVASPPQIKAAAPTPVKLEIKTPLSSPVQASIAKTPPPKTGKQTPKKSEPKSPASSPAQSESKVPSPVKESKPEVKTEPLKEPNQNIQKQDAQNKPPPNHGMQKENDNANGQPEGMDTSETEVKGSLKRHLPHNEKSGIGGKRKKREHGPSQPKNALVQLNELKKGLVYVVESQEGPPHSPTFVVYVEVNGEKFYGKGRSKQEGKHAAAQAALASFVQFPKMPEAVYAMQKSVISSDFTSDSIEEERSIFQCFTPGEGAIVCKAGVDEFSSPISQKRVRKALSSSENKNPIMVLNELHPGLQYNQVGENNNTPTQRFVMSVQIGDEVFEGSGQSKKLAKAAAARAAISSLYGQSLCSLSTIPDMPDTPISRLPPALADKIGQAVFKKFAEVMGNDEEHQKWKVLAGVVMTVGPETENITVISVSSGTKCIGGEHMSMNGASLHDCHAEIISQRCLKDFLFNQLETCLDEYDQDSVLEKKPSGQYGLKPGVKFHLYISTAPCGDARIFSPNELLLDAIDRHPMRRARGLLRSKIEAGEGTIPIKPTDRILTWDGIIQGQQRLLTMSCSDKILRWNVLGIQGCLLSYYIEPIYLESIILGSLLHPGHMGRAVYGRIENELGILPEPYHLNKPNLNMVSSTEARQLNKSPTFSVNWSIGMSSPEIVNGTTGKLQNGQVSRLAKRSFLIKFAELYKRTQPGLKHVPLEKKPYIYSEVKAHNAEYQLAKEAITKALFNANLGLWVKKPVELDDFEVNF